MLDTPWEDLQGTVLGETYRLESLVRGGTYRALFVARDLTRDTDGAVSVQVFSGDGRQPLEQLEKRFREAMFLDHPHLAQILAAGITPSGELLYVVSEKADYTLPQFIENRPLPEADARELTEQLVSGLEYLHSENFVFCNLGVESVWRIGSSWKLADFSELRVIGSGNRRELRIAMSRLSAAPPEAFEGVVTPAWDVWSLGALLRRVLTPDPTHVEGSISLPRGRYLRENGLPAPFEAIARDSVLPDPASRLTFEEIKDRLGLPRVTETPTETQPVAESVESLQLDSAGRSQFSAQVGNGSSGEASEQPIPEEPPRHEYVFPPYRGSDSAPEQTPMSERMRQLWTHVRRQPAGTRALLAFAAGILVVLLIAALVSVSNRRTASAASARTRIPAEAERSRTSGPIPPSFGSGTKESPAVPYEEKSGRDEDNIRALLNRWLDAGRKRDAAAQADCYAPVVNTYYNRHRVSRGDIQRDRQRQYQTIGTVHQLDASNVQISQLSPDTSVILFDKTWDFGDRNKFSGAERAQLTLAKIGGKWKITGERELKVYRVHRSRGGAPSALLLP